MYTNTNNPTYLAQQSATFTHIYTQAGNYTPVFTVTNNNGQTTQTSLSINVLRSTSYYNSPSISSITPTSGAAGTQVTIYGNGFSTNGCTTSYCNNSYSSPDVVNFGPSIISNAYSASGNSLTFTIPSYTNTNTNSSYLYPTSYPVSSCNIPQYQIMSGTYPVFVTNANGISNVINFTVTYPTR
jgi:hypothetical protein